MKLNSPVIAIIVLLGVALVAGAYQLGQQGASKPEPVLTETPTPAPLVQSASVVKPTSQYDAQAGQARFSHFRVGNRNVKSMYADGRYVWVGTSGGVIRYDSETDNYEMFNNKNSGLLSNGVFHVSAVNEWMVVGTYGGGLSLFNVEKNEWANMNIPQGLADQFVYDVEVMANGDVWIATWSGANLIKGGNFFDDSAWEIYTVENTNGGLPNPWVYNVAEGNNGDVWFATEGGLARFTNGEWVNWQHEDGLGAPLDVVEKSIQFKNDPARSSNHHARQKDEQGLSNVDVAYNPNYVISMAVAKDGTVWAGTWGAGLARFDGKTWKNYTTEDGLPANHIFMLYLDKQETLWIGTNGGLVRFHEADGRFEIRTTADGLYANNVFSMAEGDDGSLWIGSFGGVAHIEQRW